MYEKILAPLDGSEFSECALNHVRAIATGCQVREVVLLRVIEPFPQIAELGNDFNRGVQERAQVDAKDYLSKVADDLKKEGVVVETVIIQGRAAEEVLDYADRNQVGLIVMSTHGRSGVSRWVIGSVADRVLRHSAVPVLVVSPPGCKR